MVATPTPYPQKKKQKAPTMIWKLLRISEQVQDFYKV